MHREIAIAGIHTDIGKTLVAATLAQAFGADYWKPVQAGSIHSTDSMHVKNLVSNPRITIHPEAVTLQMAASPHTAAAHEKKHIDFTKFTWPSTSNALLVETAGGLLSPMNNEATMADFISHYNLSTFLVTRHYLGSINHTLLCLEVMKVRKIPLLGLIVSGAANESSEAFLKQYAGLAEIYHIPELSIVGRESISMAAAVLKEKLKGIIYEQFAESEG